MSNETVLNWLLPEESVTVTTVAVVMSLVSIISNSVLIYMVIRTAVLRTSANFFIASLSAGELLTGLFVIPFAGSSMTSPHWTFSSHLCSFVGLMSVLGPSVSALSLLAVSADRCLAVSKPFSYASLITKTSTLVIILVVWSWSLLMSLLPFASYGSYGYSADFRVCKMRSSVTGRVPEVVVKEVLCIFLPMALVVFTVLKSVYHIRMHRRVFVLVPALVAITSVPAVSSNVNNRPSNVKASRTLLLVLTVFVTLCVPSTIASVLCHRPTTCYVTPRILRTLLWMSFLSCVIIPVIIMTLNRKFRVKLSSLLYQNRCCLGQQSKGEKEPFTISTGLQAVLEASIFVQVVQEPGSHDVGGVGPVPSLSQLHVDKTSTTHLTVPSSTLASSSFTSSSSAFLASSSSALLSPSSLLAPSPSSLHSPAPSPLLSSLLPPTALLTPSSSAIVPPFKPSTL